MVQPLWKRTSEILIKLNVHLPYHLPDHQRHVSSAFFSPIICPKNSHSLGLGWLLALSPQPGESLHLDTEAGALLPISQITVLSLLMSNVLNIIVSHILFYCFSQEGKSSHCYCILDEHVPIMFRYVEKKKNPKTSYSLNIGFVF